MSQRGTLPLFAAEGATMDASASGPGLTVIERCSDAWAELHARIAHRFARSEARERAGRYLAALLGRLERKNGWQLAEAMGEAGPRGVQRLLSAATWDADGVRDDLREYVVEHLGDAATGVLIVDETGFVKKGTKSCGAARQYTGTAGDTVNCQVGVFLAYASATGAAFVDRALYLPQEWTEDRGRRTEAGIPEETEFATKIELAQRMLARAFDAGVPARWVVGDAFSGRSHELRRWLEEQGRSYALMIPKTNAVRYRGRRERAEQLGERLCPEPSLGPWACLELSEECAAGMRRWLLVRCDAEDPKEHRYFLVCGPEETAVEELVRVCESRWQIEECFAEAKGEVGLDQYEVRKWAAWHRHATLCLLAHAYLVAMRLAARQEELGEKGAPSPA
jgi:SRSO17 transposase